MNKIINSLFLTLLFCILFGCDTVDVYKNTITDQEIGNILLGGKWYLSEHDPNFVNGFNVVEIFTEDHKVSLLVFSDHACEKTRAIYEANWKVRDNKLFITQHHRTLPTLELQKHDYVNEVIFIDGQDRALRNIDDGFISYSTRKNTCRVNEDNEAHKKTKT